MKILIRLTREETGEMYETMADVTCLSFKDKQDDMILVESAGGRTQGVMSGDVYKVEAVSEMLQPKSFNTIIDLIGLKPHNINIQFGKK